MINYDMHIHTAYCGHAPQMTIPAIIDQANQLDLDTIAIAAHIYSTQKLSTLKQITGDIARTKPKCKVIVGAEIDVDARFLDGRFVTDQLDGIDYIVAGMHYIPTVTDFTLTLDGIDIDPEKHFKNCKATILGVVENPRIDTLAHPARMMATTTDYDKYCDDILEVLTQAARISAKNNIAWGLNELNGNKLSEKYKQQWHKVYKIAIDAGVKIIYGSDAHKPEQIGKTNFVQTILDKLPPNCLSTPESL